MTQERRIPYDGFSAFHLQIVSYHCMVRCRKQLWRDKVADINAYTDLGGKKSIAVIIINDDFTHFLLPKNNVCYEYMYLNIFEHKNTYIMRNKFITNVLFLDMGTLTAFIKSLDRVVQFVMCWWACVSPTGPCHFLTVTQSCWGSLCVVAFPSLWAQYTPAARAVIWVLS